MKSILLHIFILCLSLNVSAFAQEVPENVRSEAIAKSKNKKIVKWITDKTRAKYLAITEVGSVIEIDLNGKWIRTSQILSEKKLPLVLKNAVSKYSSENDLDNYTYIEDAKKGNFYSVDLTPIDDEDGDYSTLYIDINGKEVGKEKR